MSENVLNDSQRHQRDSKEYNLGVSTIHGAESFYNFKTITSRKKLLFVMEVLVCVLELKKN